MKAVKKELPSEAITMMELGLLIIKIALVLILLLDACHKFICFKFRVPNWERALYAMLLALIWVL